MTARLDRLAKGLLPALLWLSASCAPGLPLRIEPMDATAPADAMADAGAPADVASRTCPLRNFAAPGANVPGDFCTGPEDCAHGAEQLSRCEPRDRNEAQLKLQRCHIFTRARLGEPCTLTVTTAGDQVGAYRVAEDPLADFGGFCELGRGLVCDSFARQCRALPVLGQSCANHGYCARGSFCLGDVCVAALPLGASCQGVGDFVDQPQCEPSARCDIAMNACVPAIPEGGTCDYGPQCASNVCINTTCAPEGTCPP